MYDYWFIPGTLVTVYMTVQTDVDCAACNAFSNAGCAKGAGDWSARGRGRQRTSVRMQSSQLARPRWLGERASVPSHDHAAGLSTARRMRCMHTCFQFSDAVDSEFFARLHTGWGTGARLGKTGQDSARQGKTNVLLGFSIVFVCWKDTKEELIYAVLRKFAMATVL